MVHSILYRACVILVVYDVGHNLIRNLRRVWSSKTPITRGRKAKTEKKLCFQNMRILVDGSIV